VSGALPDVPFHDAEVLAMRFDRAGPTLEVDVEVFAQLPEARIERIRFTNVSDVELGGLNEQNVLFDLKADSAADGRWDVTLQSTYGLGGSFRCAAIESLPT
jgi:hypothetical protein